ncbi:Osmotin-like protein [Linum grandiflorum]
MASTQHILYAVVSLLFLLTPTQSTSPLTITLVNNCPFTVYPAIQPSAGSPILQNGGGFPLHHFTHRSFPAPNHHWSGRIWARTGCSHTPDNKFRCLTGDCGNRLECNGLGGATPATLVQFSLHHGSGDFSSYGVSLVDGYIMNGYTQITQVDKKQFLTHKKPTNWFEVCTTTIFCA